MTPRSCHWHCRCHPCDRRRGSSPSHCPSYRILHHCCYCYWPGPLGESSWIRLSRAGTSTCGRIEGRSPVPPSHVGTRKGATNKHTHTRRRTSSHSSSLLSLSEPLLSSESVVTPLTTEAPASVPPAWEEPTLPRPDAAATLAALDCTDDWSSSSPSGIAPSVRSCQST